MKASHTILVTGGAGFLGSHLCALLLTQGHNVIAFDNLYTGAKQNISALMHNKAFSFVEGDITEALPDFPKLDFIYNLACPASPPHYQNDPIQTMKINVIGALHLLDLARDNNARILQASTSEVYGDPTVHPQQESYWGHVNPMGPRSCYDVGKRAVETLFYDYQHQYGVDTRIIRIFNTYGPHMNPNDGRVVSNFIMRALDGEQPEFYGEGSQTRSFCYVSDLIEGMTRIMNYTGETQHEPFNIGNPNEITIKQLAETIYKLIDTQCDPSYKPLPKDDPQRRKPDITRAQTYLNWEPKVTLDEGLSAAIAYFKPFSSKKQST